MMSKEPKRNVYVGHRYVPKIMGEWDPQETYEGLSIVTHQGTSYTSKKRVPVGIDITNEEYWVVTGNYNAQVDYYRDEVKQMRIDFENDLLNMEKEIVETNELIGENPYRHGIKFDGTDETDKIQEYIDYCLANNKKIIFPAVEIPLSKPLKIDSNVNSWTDVYIEGVNYQSPYSSEVNHQTGTRFLTNDFNAFTITPKYPSQSLIIKNISGINKGVRKEGNFVEINMSDISTTTQFKTLYMENVTTYNFGRALMFKDNLNRGINAPYSYINKLYTYKCKGGIELNNVNSTIFNVQDSLIHGSDEGGFIFNRSVEISFNNTWFEGCEPACIVKYNTHHSTINLNDTYFESSGKNSGNGAWLLDKNTEIVINGRSNLPGAREMPPPSLPPYCSLASYTDRVITIKSNGGLVKTPNNIRLSEKEVNIVFYPLHENNANIERKLILDNYSIPKYNNEGLKGFNLIEGINYNNTSLDKKNEGFYIITFIYDVESGESFSLGADSYYVKNGQNVPINTLWLRDKTDRSVIYVCQIVLPSDGITGIVLNPRNQSLLSVAQVSHEKFFKTIAEHGHVTDKVIMLNYTIDSNDSDVILLKGKDNTSYNIETELVINDGEGITLNKHFGKTYNPDKKIENLFNNIPEDINVEVREGSHNDLFNFKITNNRDESIKATLFIKYN